MLHPSFAPRDTPLSLANAADECDSYGATLGPYVIMMIAVVVYLQNVRLNGIKNR